ncbi:carboxypeptidase-like regulatory domain-containing protein [Gramella lutea]|uniref:Carboxypeptidase-like regulatory domain-containing protein n=1 Tax=Christiangramia lutea TaxID=1607951 RepID=A0A9X1V4L1_9FLAO|nr:carboxypeptidase-like regulatory domain-containing protein [Christiangramia lutea]MCH4824074.1 carboxypeptidase-like regulatory domain-containing protein [Christiangramia lutea]
MSINFFKNWFSLLLFICIFSFSAQAQEPVLVSGKVSSNNPDLDRIHIINLNLEKGVVTNAKGEFQIPVRENDSLYISSVQYENRTIIITSKNINDRRVVIELQDAVNELAEVVIDDINLSGYLVNDINKISIADVERKNLLQDNLNTFIEKDRKLNPYEKPSPVGSIPVGKIAGMVIDKLSKNKDRSVNYTPKELANRSIAIVGREFFREDLELKENEICNFLYYCTEDISFKHLVINNNNAFVLIEYFETRIDDFRNLRGSMLNESQEIPG